MKPFILALIPGLLLGWVVAVMLRVNPLDSTTKDPAPPERITILGSEALDGEIPLIRKLDRSSNVTDILDRLENASQEEIKRWLNSWTDSPGPPEEVMESVIKHFISLGAAEAVEFLNSKKDFEPYLESAFEEWARIDHLEALKAALDQEVNHRALRSVVKYLDARQWEDVYAGLLAEGLDEADPFLFLDLVSASADLNPELATTGVMDLREKNGHPYTWQIIKSVFPLWYKENPETAFAWGIENMLSTEGFSKELLNVAVEHEGVEGLSRLWDQLDDQQRSALAVSGHSFIIDPEHTDSLLEWIDTHVDSPVLYGAMVEGVADGLVHSEHPERLPDILAKLDPDFNFDSFNIEGVTKRWAERDLEGLQKWMESIENPSIRDAASSGIFAHLVDTDPLKAADYWVENEPVNAEFDPYYRLSAILDPRSVVDPEETIDRLPESVRDEGVGFYASYAPMEAPEETLRFLEVQPEGRKRNGALQIAMSRWSRLDPVGAAEWVGSIEDEAQAKLAFRNLANTWVRFDPQGAQEWIENQPASANRDIAAKQIIEHTYHHYPENAFSLAMTVADEEVREGLIQHSLRNFARQDPDRALEQLEAAGLSAKWREIVEEERAVNAVFAE